MHVYDGGILCIFDIGINFSVGSTHLRRIAAYTYASRNRCKSRSKDIQFNSIQFHFAPQNSMQIWLENSTEKYFQKLTYFFCLMPGNVINVNFFCPS